MPATIDQPKKRKMIVSSRALLGTPKNPVAVKTVDRSLSAIAATSRVPPVTTATRRVLQSAAGDSTTRQPSKSAPTMPKSTQPARSYDLLGDELTELMARREDKDRQEFEEEPAELHSDADLEEEIMFTDREVTSRLTKKTLQYSSKKIPPPITLDEEVTAIPPQCERQVQMMEVEANSEQETTTTTPVPQTKQKGNKRGCENSVSATSNSKPAKIPKTTETASEPRTISLKAANLPPVTKEVFGVAVSAFRSLICTKAPFPTTAIEETHLAQEAWKVACQRKGIEVSLPPMALTLLLKHTSQVRGELKTKIRGLVAPFFGFRASDTRDVIKRNRDRAESLKEGSRFAFKDWENRKEIYKSDLIQLSINQMWFANRNDEGVAFAHYFNPIPIKTIALVLTAIECCIDEWASGVKTDINFAAAAYGDVYRKHVKHILEFDEHTAAYDLLDRIQQTLHDMARCYSGAEPIKSETNSIHAVDTQAFQDAIEEYEQEIQDNMPDTESIEDVTDGKGQGGDSDDEQGNEGGCEGDGMGEVEAEVEGGFEDIEDGGEGAKGEVQIENTQ